MKEGTNKGGKQRFCSVPQKRCPTAREAVACLVVLLPVQTGTK